MAIRILPSSQVISLDEIAAGNMTCHACNRAVACEPIPRPSHPTPSTAQRHVLPVPQSHIPRNNVPPRPQLRIITQPIAVPAGMKNPIPIRHPGLIKSAPLHVPMSPTACPLADATHHWQTYRAQDLPSDVILRVSAPTQPPATGRAVLTSKNDAKGHKRRLSDKFKHLFSALHLKKNPHTPSSHAFTREEDFELLMSISGAQQYKSPDPPVRPYRSPDTASFLVTRHLSPRPTSTSGYSPQSSFTAVAPVHRPTFAEKRDVYLAAPGTDISHFSDPSTLESALSGSGRSVSSGEVLDKSAAGLEGSLN